VESSDSCEFETRYLKLDPETANSIALLCQQIESGGSTTIPSTFAKMIVAKGSDVPHYYPRPKKYCYAQSSQQLLCLLRVDSRLL
jgi:hypothetical protein